ncbi:MAG: hypothetical protein AN482_12670 [Anabaena sp. LE011-02]|nr:hypothetical protein [Dolichospermum sp.]OBQ08591.1 MAG: hypothetical protein AN482_12670 [Anabaena sp. LE011-02]
MQSNPQSKKEYKDVNVEVRSGDLFLPLQTIKCSLFCIYSKPFSPYPGSSKYEAMARIDNSDLQELVKTVSSIVDPKSYASFILFMKG